ncbi:MAG: hypothetical protein WCK02_06300 [Bacteroidota bacterium]
MRKYIFNSNTIIIVVLFVLIAVQFNVKRWNKSLIIDWDVKEYYGYLPATFIYHDLHLKYFDTIPSIKKYGWYKTTESGDRVFKMSMGMSMLYLPSFFIVNAWQHYSNRNSDGYCVPYQKALALNVMLYLFFGLLFLSKVLHRYFSKLAVWLTLIFIVFGTNLLFYSTNESGMPHDYSFSLFSIFLWSLVNWFEQKKIQYALLLGFLVGLISLIRPTNSVIVVFLVLYKCMNFNDFKNNISLFFKYWKHWVPSILLCLIVWVPQLLYWKEVTGHYIHYSYDKEGFFFNNPQITNVLFSYRKGWFVYTPLAIFALIGLFLLSKKQSEFRWSIIFYLIVHVYIVSCWWCWWYGGCYGQRAMIESFAFLSIPLAAFFDKICDSVTWHRVVLWLIMFFIFVTSIIQTLQYRYTIIHWDAMTKEAYWKVFLKVKKPKDIKNYLDEPNYDKRMRGEDE